MTQFATIAASEAASDLSVTERRISNLWIEVLRDVTPPKPTDNFFAIGGDSMDMVTLEFRIGEEIGVDLPPGTVLSAPTLRQLSTLVDSLLSSRPQNAIPSADIPDIGR